MYFSGLSELWYMDGHGVYVWGVYGVAAVIIAALAISPLLKRRRLMREEIGRLARHSANQTHNAVG
jgi:heme exporter protein D